VHVPRGLQERALRVDAAQRRLTGRLGRVPRTEELAEYVKLSRDETREALGAARAYSSASLDAPATNADDGTPTTYTETHGAEDDRFEMIDADLTIRAAAAGLTARERRLLHLRFARDLTQTQIAERFGVSQMQVSRLLRNTLDRLRALSEPAFAPPTNG
jgi:RNA polymerase sigma-B factor